ncbi:MAG: diguanylate cyclase [Herbinix sp.]|nr:diguanylate cyclase [Herbinix sp.]
MNFIGNLIINLYSIALLIIIYFQSLKQVEKDSLQYKIYMMMLKMTILLIVIDIFSRLDCKSNTLYLDLYYFGNFMIFFLNLVMPSLWLLYVYVQFIQEESKIKHIISFLVALNCVNAVMVVISQYFGWFYYFDSENIYHRGPIFLLPVAFIFVLIVFAYFLIIKNRKMIDKKHCITLAFFVVPPCTGIVLQVVFYGISIILNCLVFSLLLVFLNIQNYNLYTDYLTGVNNRKKLDIYLRDKIKTSADDKTFSAIMLDLDNFKNINDTWGHDVGDSALRMSIKLLNSCIRVDDFIARYGGDEFCIILDISNKNDLEIIVQRINNCFTEYNEASNQPYKLFCSIGYALYDYHSCMKMEEFLKQLDILMYENKQHKKDNVEEYV